MVVLQSSYTRRFSPFTIYMIPYFLTNSRQFRDCKLHKSIIMEASVINEEIPEANEEFYDIRWTKMNEIKSSLNLPQAKQTRVMLVEPKERPEVENTDGKLTYLRLQ